MLKLSGGHTRGLHAVVSNGRKILSADEYTVRVWDVETGEVPARLPVCACVCVRVCVCVCVWAV